MPLRELNIDLIISAVYSFLTCCYLVLQPTEKCSVPLRELNVDLIISVVYSISDAAI
jgi:hypothetical protein